MFNIRIAYANLPPFVIVENVHGNDVLDGFMPQIVKAVARELKWNVTYIKEPEDVYGIWENGTWTGMVGMLYRNEVDLILNPILPKKEVLEFARFTNPITVEAYTFLSGKKTEEPGFFLYFSVLRYTVWITVLMTLVLVSLTSAFLYGRIRETRDLQSISYKYFWKYLADMFRQNPTEKYLLRESDSSLSMMLPILATLWIICIGLVMNAFQSLLVSKLTVKKSQPYVDSMADILKTDKTIPIVPIEIGIQDALENSGIDLYEEVWKKVEKNMWPGKDVFLDKTIIAVQDGKYCIIHGKLILRNILGEFFKKHSFCQLHISEHFFFPFPLLLAMNREIPEYIFDHFNLGLTRLLGADIAGRTFKAAAEVSNYCTSYSDSELKPLGTKNIYGVLLMWAAGLSVSILALLCEIMNKRFYG
ncbi:Glutamate receptor ionotropic like protein [Argiope bruennichi]|uniref:Glutamate receptor ionotropic like protein n=1 Tax=Argiope bruennichi TaxID=94029 RepID=A0A8T0EQN1_ARGBR|nr:Glutamate receptor ionotropic like protein [Argiope bruennichi]